jgi:hypothetical protein
VPNWEEYIPRILGEAELSGPRLARKHRMEQPPRSMLVRHLPFLWLLLLSQTLPLDQELGLRLGFSGLTIFLLLADLRSSLGEAAFYEISLNLELLLRV